VSALLPLVVAVPLLAAPLMSGVGHWLPKRADDAAAIATAAAATVLAGIATVRSVGSPLLHWFGGWEPRGSVALGISFVVDPIGGGLALLAGFLTLVAFVYSWRYFDEVGTLFHVLMLLFLGAMCGFALTGDIFNMFVFFELMSTAAFALAGYKVEEPGPLQGAFNFGVTNSVGGFFVLTGIALLYGRTGALNLAQIGNAIAQHKPDGLLIAAFVLLTVGFLIKAAAVPFHFWLADAHAVAPAPVCVLFSGVMVELGLYAVARIFWTVFSTPFAGHGGAIRDILLTLGIVTGLVGAVMAFLQRHLKRLLAYSTIAHMGIFLIGVALLTPDGVAGTAMYALAHGLAKGSLFLSAGILLERLESVDELHLFARGRALPLTGLTWLVATFAMCSFPFVGTWAGHALIEDAAGAIGKHWLAPVLALITIVSTAAIFRAGGRVFLGLGEREDPLLSPQPEEEPSGQRHVERPGLLLVGSAGLLAVAAVAVSVVVPLATHAQQASERFVNRPDYEHRVLDGRPPEAIPLPRHVTTGESVLWGLVSTGGAVALGAFGLYRRRLPGALRDAAWRALDPGFAFLRGVHSGHVGDYVAWITLGAAALGGAFALGLT
jgi:multicomponent Na+:H+ antiporter subunit D